MTERLVGMLGGLAIGFCAMTFLTYSYSLSEAQVVAGCDRGWIYYPGVGCRPPGSYFPPEAYGRHDWSWNPDDQRRHEEERRGPIVHPFDRKPREIGK